MNSGYAAKVDRVLKRKKIFLQSGFSHLGLGIGSRLQGRFDLARNYFEEGLKIFWRLGRKGMTAVMTSEIARTQRALGNFVEAKKTYQETMRRKFIRRSRGIA